MGHVPGARSNVECENCKMRKMWSKIFASSLYAGLEECQEKQPKDTKTYRSVSVHICTWGWTGGHQGAAFLVGSWRQRGGCGQELGGISCHSPSEEKTDNCMCTSAIKNTTWKRTFTAIPKLFRIIRTCLPVLGEVWIWPFTHRTPLELPHSIVCSYLTQFSQNCVKYFWDKKSPNIPNGCDMAPTGTSAPSLNGAGDLKEKHVVLYLEKTERGRMDKKYFCKKKKKRKIGAKIWKMSEMRGAAVSPLGWQDFTARKCRRRRQRNTTPREKTLNQTRAIVPTNFPQILELSPKFASALFEISLFPYIKI